jgi:hypothetical protein
MTSITDSFAINPAVPAERPRGGAVPTTPTPARFSDMYRGAIASATYELVGARTGNCLRAAIALEAAGMFYTVRRLDLAAGEQHGYPHLALNPAGRARADGGAGSSFVLTQSNAIVLFAAERAPHALLPGGAAAHGAASQSPTTRIRREPTASRWPASHSSRCTSTARSRRTKPAVPSSRHGSNARPGNAGAPNTVQPSPRCGAPPPRSRLRDAQGVTSGRPRRTNEVHHCPTGHLAPGHASTARPLALCSHVPARAGISRLDRQVIALTV